jgi:hypothetical protein
MLRPALGFKRLVELPEAKTWNSLRRPLLVGLMSGCMFSLWASQRLTLRHLVDGTLNGSLLLFGQFIAMAFVRRGTTISYSRAIDLYFSGFGPWLVWMIGMSAVWAFAPMQAFVWAGLRTILISVSLVVLWSAYIDFQFFRQVFKRSAMRAAWDLLQHRVVSWLIFMVIFGSGASPDLLKLFGK